MLSWTDEQLKEVGGIITTKEIIQQPRLWGETLEVFENKVDDLNQFLQKFQSEMQEKVRVIFTGAGTSAYVGDVVRPHLIRYGSTDQFIFEAIPTTDIVSSPYSYLKENQPTLLVSFARSGNSPESVAAVDVANRIVKNIRHLIITCAADGQLAINSHGDDKSFVMLMPEDSNDKGFAMTGSFSCMTLTALMIFDIEHKNRNEIVDSIVAMGKQAIEYEEELQKLISEEFDRVVYLGSESLSGLTREAQLKLLELTAGRITTAFDSSLGFRHGPKSFVNDKTLVFGFISNDPYTQKYDIDILEEIKSNNIAVQTIGIAQKETLYSGTTLLLEDAGVVSDGYLALPFIMLAQIVSLLISVKVGNKPDTPSPTGTVNRVVKGVTIHSL